MRAQGTREPDAAYKNPQTENFPKHQAHASMTTITMICEEMITDLKDGFATYLRLPEIKVHVMILRHKDMVTITNMEVTPLYVQQDDFVCCILDNVLQKATVHNTAKICYDCKKINGVWMANEDQDFFTIMYPTTEPGSPKYPPVTKKRRYEMYQEKKDDA